MKSSMKNKVEGTLHESKANLKVMAGKMADNPKSKAESTVEMTAGKIQEKFGQVKKVLAK